MAHTVGVTSVSDMYRCVEERMGVGATVVVGRIFTAVEKEEMSLLRKCHPCMLSFKSLRKVKVKLRRHSQREMSPSSHTQQSGNVGDYLPSCFGLRILYRLSSSTSIGMNGHSKGPIVLEHPLPSTICCVYFCSFRFLMARSRRIMAAGLVGVDAFDAMS